MTDVLFANTNKGEKSYRDLIDTKAIQLVAKYRFVHRSSFPD